MRAPKKVIAAMAMATLIGGTGLQAFAAEQGAPVVKEPDFITTVQNGKETLQKTKKHYERTDDTLTSNIIENNLTSNGDIQINGKFIKTVNTFPEETKAGRYLRVTMPLKLNYEYNLESNEMVSGNGTITNESVLAKADPAQNNKIVEDKQAVKMTFMGLEENGQNEKIEYVESTSGKQVSGNKVQVPFGLVVKKGEDDVQTISLASIQNASKKPLNSIEIGPGASLEVKIGKINKQNIANSAALGDEIASISHNMKLRFEYAGK